MVVLYRGDREQKQLWWDLHSYLYQDEHPGAQLLRSFLGQLKQRFEASDDAKLVIVGRGIHDWKAIAGVMMSSQMLVICFIYVKPQHRGDDTLYRLFEQVHAFGEESRYVTLGIACPVCDELLSLHDLFGKRAQDCNIVTLVPKASPTGRTEEEEPVEIAYYLLPRAAFEDILL